MSHGASAVRRLDLHQNECVCLCVLGLRLPGTLLFFGGEGGLKGKPMFGKTEAILGARQLVHCVFFVFLFPGTLFAA